MNNTAVNYRIREWALLDEIAYIRRARKQHRCSDIFSTKREPCRRPIAKGEYYVEYVGETPSYQSGERYHLECAVAHGIVEPVTEAVPA